jgi:hypothetical protein
MNNVKGVKENRGVSKVILVKMYQKNVALVKGIGVWCPSIQIKIHYHQIMMQFDAIINHGLRTLI